MTEEVKKYKPTNEELEKHNKLIKESQNEAYEDIRFFDTNNRKTIKSSIVKESNKKH